MHKFTFIFSLLFFLVWFQLLAKLIKVAWHFSLAPSITYSFVLRRNKLHVTTNEFFFSMELHRDIFSNVCGWFGRFLTNSRSPKSEQFTKWNTIKHFYFTVKLVHDEFDVGWLGVCSCSEAVFKKTYWNHLVRTTLIWIPMAFSIYTFASARHLSLCLQW